MQLESNRPVPRQSALLPAYKGFVAGHVEDLALKGGDCLTVEERVGEQVPFAGRSGWRECTQSIRFYSLRVGCLSEVGGDPNLGNHQ